MLMSIFGSSPNVFIMNQNNAFDESIGVMLTYFMVLKAWFLFKKSLFTIHCIDTMKELFEGWAMLDYYFYNSVIELKAKSKFRKKYNTLFFHEICKG